MARYLKHLSSSSLPDKACLLRKTNLILSAFLTPHRRDGFFCLPIQELLKNSTAVLGLNLQISRLLAMERKIVLVMKISLENNGGSSPGNASFAHAT